MKELYCNILDSAAEMTGIGAWSEYCQGFLLGMIFVLLLFILIRILGRMMFGRRKLKGVTVAGSAGNLHVSIHAIRQFIHRILNEFDEVSLSSVAVRQQRGEILFSIDLEVTPDVELVPLRDRIQQRVVDDAERCLGLGLPVKVDLEIRSIQANARKGSRSERKQMAKVSKRTSAREPLQEDPIVPSESDSWSDKMEKQAEGKVSSEKDETSSNEQSDIDSEIDENKKPFPGSSDSSEEDIHKGEGGEDRKEQDDSLDQDNKTTGLWS